MIAYEIYKTLHLFAVIFFITSLGLQVYLEERNKKLAIYSGIFSFLVLLGGFGLLARLGISHKEGWPLWALMKLGVWILLGVGYPFLLKRVPKLKKHLWYPLGILVLIAVYAAVYKPAP